LQNRVWHRNVLLEHVNYPDVAKYEHYTCEVHVLRLFRRAVMTYVGQMQDARNARIDDSICMTIHAFVADSLTAKNDLAFRG
jgi:hypothetical protein